MNPSTAAARLSIALRPGATVHPSARAFVALATYTQFATEIHAEAGPSVLADIVREVELHAPLSRAVA